MAKIRVQIHEAGISELLSQNKYIRDDLVGMAQRVASEAQNTASDAEGGPAGRISGYADAGFAVQWQSRGGKRPRVNIVSNADAATATAAHFHSQRKNGIAHLRAALYKFTSRG